MNEPTAIRAVKDEFTEVPLEIGLHLEELKTKHLRVDRDLMGTVEARCDRSSTSSSAPQHGAARVE